MKSDHVVLSWHAAIRLKERFGGNATKFRRALESMPAVPDGEYRAPGIGTVVIEDCVIVTILDDDMVVVHRKRRKR